MSKYNGFEKKIAQFLSNNPKIKNNIKFLYQLTLSYVYRPKSKLSVESGYDLVCLGDDNKESFYGYYDHSPINDSNLVAYFELNDKSGKTSKLPRDYRGSVAVVVKSLDTSKVIYRGESRAYNWQQGARIQWLNDECIIFNDYDAESNHYFSKVVNILTSEEKRFELPVADAYSDEFFITLDYKKLTNLRPDYGYFHHYEDKTSDQDTIIYSVDIDTGESKKMFSLSDVADKGVSLEFQKINHIMISPNGESFIFMHRVNEGKRRQDNLYLFDITTANMVKLNTGSMVSHMCWVGNDNLFGYLSDKDNTPGFYHVDLKNNILTPEKALAGFSDGHPSYNEKTNELVFDTYPDKSRLQTLYKFDLSTKKLDSIAKFYHSMSYVGESRCDLHPRFLSDGSVCVDTVYTDSRKLVKLARK
ncbi:hypothetical protein SAMN04488136_11590 [Vibrio xiamenensis]|uniref:Uncharacterized protein n=1 Tax=Vibrio xiamenensis TaxID=861298 RepID=A0A1G8C7W6_9VIBR|nr:hypothetical protein [Vibrio xiamenensis]SDH41389.1 hypothetical protein SAMN04488136_11590 [Vibrio xiamenensis]